MDVVESHCELALNEDSSSWQPLTTGGRVIKSTRSTRPTRPDAAVDDVNAREERGGMTVSAHCGSCGTCGAELAGVGCDSVVVIVCVHGYRASDLIWSLVQPVRVAATAGSAGGSGDTQRVRGLERAFRTKRNGEGAS